MLTDLLASSDDWRPLLREASWKHVWLSTSRSADETGGVHFLREDGEGASYSDFVVPIQELIQSNALSCAYAIPDPPNGLIFERERVNVAYDVGLGAEMLGYVDAVEDCVVFGHGWYHDDVVDPREIDRCTRPESR